ncbi:protein translocase subunit SecF [Terriglobus roseus]|uniref:Protein-export membrane protein SecF n=1 Tax=Terriglobus roseus TaxID=392734 RepID=A0A1H4N623_9BACT|nr:protein translocase subunit SecF [Terriglobus roseus]SEB90766.1 protein translocase subunit secF [Terriglobus roseus]
MELFRDVKIDWLSKKWFFLGFSLIFSVAGVLSMLFWHHVPVGIDFKGGTQVRVSFPTAPNEDHLRQAMDRAGIHDASIQRLTGGSTGNEAVITLPQANDSNADSARTAVVGALANNYKDSSYKIEDAYTVGPTAGKQLTRQAGWAVLWSLAGMLVYLWFRFEFIYGAAAVIAVFHDTLITIGFFSLFNIEITLTVVAAILTLVGYSMNDTIVVFDRIRENLQTMRRSTLSEIVNRSINDTLSRTVIASGLTFLTVLALFIFGGEVLHGFSFALVVGILIGTYSSIAVAAPMLVAYQDWRASKGKSTQLTAGRKATV